MKHKKDGFTGQRAIVLPPAIIELLQNNEITNLLYVTDIGFYPKASGHYRTRPEGASQHILIYCTEGKGWFNVNGVHHDIEKEQFFIIEAGLPHTYAASERNPWSI